MKVSCGYDKWSIGFNEDGSYVQIEFDRYPNFGSIGLHDATVDDLMKLSNMFAQAAGRLAEKHERFVEEIRENQKCKHCRMHPDDPVFDQSLYGQMGGKEPARSIADE